MNLFHKWSVSYCHTVVIDLTNMLKKMFFIEVIYCSFNAYFFLLVINGSAQFKGCIFQKTIFQSRYDQMSSKAEFFNPKASDIKLKLPSLKPGGKPQSYFGKKCVRNSKARFDRSAAMNRKSLQPGFHDWNWEREKKENLWLQNWHHCDSDFQTYGKKCLH